MQRNIFTQVSAVIVGFLVPAIAFAGPKLPDVVGLALNIIQDLVLVIIGAALLVFLWGVLQYVITKEESGKENGRTFMLWGIVALFVMVSVWGFVFMLRTTFGLRGADTAPEVPRTVGADVAGFTGQKPLQAAVGRIAQVIATAMPVLLGLGVLFFIWGVFNFIRSENVDKKAQASMYVVWGLALLFIMVSVWGLVHAIGQTVRIDTQNGTTIEKAASINLESLIKR